MHARYPTSHYHTSTSTTILNGQNSPPLPKLFTTTHFSHHTIHVPEPHCHVLEVHAPPWRSGEKKKASTRTGQLQNRQVHFPDSDCFDRVQIVCSNRENLPCGEVGCQASHDVWSEWGWWSIHGHCFQYDCVPLMSHDLMLHSLVLLVSPARIYSLQ